MSEKLNCPFCTWCGHNLQYHLIQNHDKNTESYEGPLYSEELLSTYRQQSKDVNREAVIDIKQEHLVVDFLGSELTVNTDVPPEDCLPLPDCYRFPTHGELGSSVIDVAISLLSNRSVFLHGMPGSGKDALIHAYSAMGRIPTRMFQVHPGLDIQELFYSRSFNQEGTGWETGSLFESITKGYETVSGRVIPYLILISDIDRADRFQLETLRLILDSIKGRVQGPKGEMHNVFPRTRFAMTANTTGSGDYRSRCISANPMDASIVDRFPRAYELEYMTWDDEEPIVHQKFPLLLERSPKIFRDVGIATQQLRKAISNQDLLAEFSHRSVCAWLENAEDIIRITGNVPKDLFKRSARCWLGKMPDPTARAVAVRLMDPQQEGGMMEHGNTKHISYRSYK